MQRRTISLPDNVADALDREARRRHVPFSQVVREALEEQFGINDDEQDFPFIGLGASGYTNTSEEVDQVLDEILSEEEARESNR
jgi:metal-responsive CopG/Arc/MetJ family transcriptional regulator